MLLGTLFVIFCITSTRGAVSAVSSSYVFVFSHLELHRRIAPKGLNSQAVRVISHSGPSPLHSLFAAATSKLKSTHIHVTYYITL